MDNPNDNHRFDSLLQVAWDDFDSNRSHSLTIAKQLYRDYKSLDVDRKFKILYLKGYIYQFESYFDESAKYFFEALHLLRDKSDDLNLERKIYILQNLGLIYEKTFQYDNALKYSFDALEIAKEQKLFEPIGDLNYNIGMFYWEIGEIDKAIKYHSKSLKAYQHVDDATTNAKVYNSLGLEYMEKREFVLARKHFTKAIELVEAAINLQTEKATYISNLGESYFIENKYDKAKEFYWQALEISFKINNPDKIKWIHNNLGDVFLKEKDYQNAIAHFQKTIALGNPDLIDKELRRAYKNISEVYEFLGDYKLALNYRTKYLVQTDQLLALKEDLAEQNAQYRMKEIDWQRELMQKEVLLASVERENFWSRIFLGFSVLALVLGSRFTYVYYRKISKARHLLESI